MILTLQLLDGLAELEILRLKYRLNAHGVTDAATIINRDDELAKAVRKTLSFRKDVDSIKTVDLTQHPQIQQQLGNLFDDRAHEAVNAKWRALLAATKAAQSTPAMETSA